MKFWAIVVMLLLTGAARAAGPTREELAIRYSGPVTITATRVASQETQSPEWNHYAYSTPPAYYYCGWGYGYGCYRGGWYGFGCYGPPYTVRFNAP